MRLGKLGSQVEKGIHKTSVYINYIAVLVLFLMMLLVAVDVIGRYAFHSPFTGSYDFIEMMMVLLVFGSLAYCALQEGHVRVDVFLSRFSGRTKAILNLITFVPSIAIVGLIAWRLGDRAWTILHNLPGPATLTLLVPHWPMIILASLGSFLFTLELIIYLVHSSQALKSK